MKQTKTMYFKNLAIAALVFLAGCSNILAPVNGPPSPNDEPGTGTVRISIGGAGERTLLPHTTADGFAQFDLLFVDQNGSLDDVPVTDYVSNEPVTLFEGTWTVTVSAFLFNGETTHVAASGSAPVTVTKQVTGEAVPVILLPVENAESATGTGTFSWDLSFPADTETVTMVIMNLDRTTYQTLMLKGGTPPEGTNSTATTSAGSVSINAGSYYINTTLIRVTEKAFKRDALYILNGLTTGATGADGYAFDDSNFSRIRYVTSNANSGAGTLREAISNANEGDTIQVTLPKGSVITLSSEIYIYASMTIEGNGVTLTGNNTRLLGSGSAELTIRRIHFKDGRSGTWAGALQNDGKLTVESCIFSGNQSTYSGSDAAGGAINSTGSLTVLGCTFYSNSAIYGGALELRSGTLKLAGNLFYGNRANTGNVVYNYSSGSATSLGYNVSDMSSGTDSTSGSGYTFVTGDVQVTELPISATSFKPSAGSAVTGMVNPSAIANYPTVDFYGDPIPASAATAGAVQTAGTGYAFTLTTLGNGTVGNAPAPSADGFYTTGSFTLTANPTSANDYLAFWTVNGIKQSGTDSLAVTLDGNKDVRAVFGRNVAVTSNADDGDGTLRAALADQQDYDVITMDSALTGQTITITSQLPYITKGLTINGNGVILTQSGVTSSLLYINDSSVEVTIRRMHFKDGRASNGGAITNLKKLTLESCIFSGNQATYSDGGAVVNWGNTTILGCTFYNNSAPYGAVISGNGGKAMLAGNIFYGNTANTGNVVYNMSVTSIGYNVSDYDASGSGYTFVTGDTQVTELSISTTTFRPSAGSAVLGKVNAYAIANYPTTDFYGDPIPASLAAAGAVQFAGSGYAFTLTTLGNGTVSGAPAPNGDGYYTSGTTFTLTASSNSGVDYYYWTVNGVKQSENGTLAVTMNGNKDVRVVFGRNVTVTSNADSGDGTLRAALNNQQDYDIITLDNALTGQTITLTSQLNINTSLTINGSGVTLTQSGVSSSLISIGGSVEVTIRRVHFKDGGSSSYDGGAINNYGKLALESCIFASNKASGGGAIFTGSNTLLTVLGCTFCNNSAIYGGAIYANGNVTLAGNLFYGNRANTGNVVYISSGTVTSLGYNVTDSGGFTFVTGDVSVAEPSISSVSFNPSTGSAVLGKVTPSAIANYPTVDFYGVTIPATSAAAGAVQTAVTGYAFNLTTQGNGTVSGAPEPSADGFYPADTSFVLTANPTGANDFLAFWIVNGVKQSASVNLTITLDGNKDVRAVFWRNVPVTSNADSGAGTLRAALMDQQDYDVITMDSALTGQTITITSQLPYITKSLTINGNGVTLTQSGVTSSLLYINSAVEVTIRRVHFKGGGSNSNDGEAIYSYTQSPLTLESCIFSGNRASGGGAICTYSSNLTVLGCTFYNNSANIGGAIYNINGKATIKLGGNLFYGNTANNGSIVGNGSANSLGYNISDMANGASGYSFTTGDTQVSASSISPVSFKPYVGSAVLSSVNPSAIPNYPTVDFYGDPIPASFAAAGAVQTAGTGYAFTLTTQGNGTIGGAPAASADGFYTSGSSFILTASAASGYSFAYWTVNGVKQSGTGNLSVTLNENKEVRAVFGRNAAGSGYVFTTTGEYRQTITVAGSSVTIEGSDNGFSDKGVFVAGRTVTLSPYSMAKYQTTWELWNEVRTWAQSHGYSIENEGYQGHDSVSSSGSGSGTSGSSWTVEQRQRRPVTMISWYDAIVWCNAYSEMSGLEPVYYYNEVILERSADGGKAVMDRSKNGYRLPTEAEWEFAARGGDPTAADWAYEYAGSDTAGDVGWYYDNAYSNAGTDYGAHTVGTKAANRLGIYDLSGNVWEWCWDWYGGSLSGSVTDPAGASSGSYRVLRGGGWCSDAQDLRSSYRFYYRPDYRYYYYGFRIVRF